MTDLRSHIREAREDIVAYLRGDASRVIVQTLRVPDDVDVRAVRESLALTQKQFADMFGFKLSAVQSWERKANRRRPGRTARVLLTALQHRPRAVLEALVERPAA
jgi:putative transcriptional regulator